MCANVCEVCVCMYVYDCDFAFAVKTLVPFERLCLCEHVNVI